jgi:Vitamin K epoxide reductase family
MKPRAAIAALAFLGVCIASYLAAYQLGLTRSVWDPLFGSGSERVLHFIPSPIPDAALGALAYACELVLVLAGARRRWLRLLGTALALAALGLVALQAFAVHAWCFLCLMSAAISLAIAALTELALRRISTP